MTTTLVTGGTGFIGSALVRLLLKRGQEVRIPTRHPDRGPFAGEPGVEQIQCDLTEPAACERALEGCSQAYHLAGWISTRRADRDAVRRANVDTTRHLLAAIAKLEPERVVYLASIFALGGGTQHPVHESTPYNLEHSRIPYFRAKRDAELLVAAAIRRGAPIVSAYPTACLGAGDERESSSGIVLEYLRQAARVWVRGGMNVVHVEDAARGLVLAMDRGETGRQYLLGGDDVSWRELHGRAARIAGVPPPRIPIPRHVMRAIGLLGERWPDIMPVDRGGAELFTQYWYYDDSRARAELGYESRPLDETLRESVAWYRAVGKLRAPAQGG